MEFINRTNEKKYLTDLLNMESDDNNKIILLYGYSGVGKTGLIHQLFSTTFSSQNCIQIHISKNSVETIENGSYFHALYKCLTKYSEQSNGRILTPSQYGLSNYKEFLSGLIHIIKNKLGLSDSDKLFENTDEPSILRKKDYIVTLLNKYCFIISFENIQNIDTLSMELLSNIIEKTHGNIFIMEYTITDYSNNNFLNFYSELMQFNAELISFQLEKMNFCEAIKINPTLKDNYQIQNLHAIYNSNHGNLLIIKLSLKNKSVHPRDIIKEALDALTNDEIFITNIISLNGGNMEIVDIQSLFHMVHTNSNTYLIQVEYNETIKSLISKNILEIKEATIFLHDSIIEKLEKQRTNSVVLAAYSLLVEYYKEKCTSTDQAKFLHLFSLYIRFSDERIYELLPEIRRIILECKYPNKIIEKIYCFRQNLQKNNYVNPRVYNEVCAMLTEICIEIEDEKNAWENFLMIPPNHNSFRYNLLNAKLYSLSSDRNSLQKIDLIRNTLLEDNVQHLMVDLCRLRLMLRVCTQKESMDFANSLLNNTDYQLLPDYGQLLLNVAEIVDSIDKSIKMYEDAAVIFAKYDHTKIFVPFCDVNLSMSYGYKGCLEKSRAHIALAASSSIIRQAYISNNLAVLDILEHRCTYDTIERLDNSLLLTSNSFERIIIQNNLLIAYIQCKDMNSANKIRIEIEKSNYERYKNGEFLQMNYQNLLYFYRAIHSLEKIAIYEQKIDFLIKDPTTSNGTKKLAQLMKNGEACNDLFYSHFPYRAEFLCYWGIPAQFYSFANEQSIS